MSSTARYSLTPGPIQNGALNLTAEDIYALAQNSFEASFLEKSEKIKCSRRYMNIRIYMHKTSRQF